MNNHSYRRAHASMLLRASQHPAVESLSDGANDLRHAAALFDKDAVLDQSIDVSAADLRAAADYFISHGYQFAADTLLAEAEDMQDIRPQTGLVRREVADVVSHCGSRVKALRFDPNDPERVWIETLDNASRLYPPTMIDDLDDDLRTIVAAAHSTL